VRAHVQARRTDPEDSEPRCRSQAWCDMWRQRGREARRDSCVTRRIPETQLLTTEHSCRDELGSGTSTADERFDRLRSRPRECGDHRQTTAEAWPSGCGRRCRHRDRPTETAQLHDRPDRDERSTVEIVDCREDPLLDASRRASACGACSRRHDASCHHHDGEIATTAVHAVMLRTVARRKPLCRLDLSGLMSSRPMHVGVLARGCLSDHLRTLDSGTPRRQPVEWWMGGANHRKEVSDVRNW
jgi:hypothetical protein